MSEAELDIRFAKSVPADLRPTIEKELADFLRRNAIGATANLRIRETQGNHQARHWRMTPQQVLVVEMGTNRQPRALIGVLLGEKLQIRSVMNAMPKRSRRLRVSS